MYSMKNRASGQSKVIAIVAGGALDGSVLPQIRQAHTVIGVDRGALWLLRHRITPDVAIGDFDSITTAEKKRIHDHSDIYIEYVPEKDATDLELAIDHTISLKPKEVMLFGVLGRRFDHAMGAVHMLLRLESHNIYGVIVDNFSKINIVRRQEKILRSSAHSYVSVIPFGSDAVVSLKGFRYDVIKKKFTLDSSLGISNEIVEHVASVHVHQGMVLVIQSTD